MQVVVGMSKFPLDSHDVNLAMDYCETPSLFGYWADFLELSRIIIQEKNLMVPKNAADAKTLYITLIQEIENCKNLIFLS